MATLTCPACNRVFPDGTPQCPFDQTALVTAAEPAAPPTPVTPWEPGRRLGEAEIEAIVSRPYQVEIGRYLGEGWQIIKGNLGWFIGYTLLLVLIQAALQAVPILGSLASIAVSGPLNAGYYFVALQMRRGQPVEFRDFFNGFNFFLALLLAGLVSSVLIFIGFLLLVLPGLYLAVSWIFTVPLIVDKRMDFWQAMETSRRLVGKQWFSLFGFALVLGLINIAGFLALIVGLLITVPLSLAATAVAYDEIVGGRRSP